MWKGATVILTNDGGWDAAQWLLGPWNSTLPAAVGFSGHAGTDEHHHREMFEMYLVASGTATLVVGGQSHVLSPGVVAVVEPGEDHYFCAKSDDYRHFVVQTPFVEGDKFVP